MLIPATTIQLNSAPQHHASSTSLRSSPAKPVKARISDNSEYYVEVASQESVFNHINDWDDLALHAVEPNPFFESWMIKEAMQAFRGNSEIEFVLVYRFTGKPQDPPTPQLCGLFPLEKRHRFQGIPLQYWSLWRHYYACLCVPLIRENHVTPTLEAFFDWIHQNSKGFHFLKCEAILGEGPIHQAMIDVLRQRGRGMYVMDAYNRAILRPSVDAEAYIETSMTTHNRQEQRRLRRRMSESGKVEFQTLERDSDLEHWIDLFLNLEGCGWKGSEQTSMRANPLHAEYFRRIASSAFLRKQLTLMGLFLDGKPIAVKCNFHSGKGAFAFKIGFDESLARFSPGVQLEIENIRWVHAHPQVAWMDSCAKPLHFMINRLWKDRRTIHNTLISTGHRSSEFLMGLIPFCRGLRRTIRGITNSTHPSE